MVPLQRGGNAEQWAARSRANASAASARGKRNESVDSEPACQHRNTPMGLARSALNIHGFQQYDVDPDAELPAVVSAGFSPIIRVVPTDFSTIQDAVDAANPGDTILVRPGLYDENVSIDTDNLTVLGSCQAKNMPFEFQDDPTQMTLVDGGTDGNVFDISASDVRLACLTTRHGFTGINVSQFGIPPQSALSMMS